MNEIVNSEQLTSCLWSEADRILVSRKLPTPFRTKAAHLEHLLKTQGQLALPSLGLRLPLYPKQQKKKKTSH